MIGELSLALIIVSGLIDGINPCAIAVLVFLLTYLLSINGKTQRKKILIIGITYITVVYITYFLAGIGLLTAIQTSGIPDMVVTVAASIAIIAGILCLKDFFWYGKFGTLEIPKKMRPKIHSLIENISIPGAILLGFFVALVELPCSGAVYFAILAMLSQQVTQVTAIGYLLVYNLMFILPLIIVLIAVFYGLKIERVRKWKEQKKNWLKLFMGIVLILLGTGLLLRWF